MLYVCTAFRIDGLPSYTCVYENKNIDFYPLYIKNSGRTLYDISKDIEYISNRINDSECVIFNDSIQHIKNFNINNRNIYDADETIKSKYENDIKKDCIKLFLKFRNINKFPNWMKIRARAGYVYNYLMNKGVVYGYKIINPIWSMDTYSGRSKCSGFPLQGITDPFLANKNGDNIYINFDWISADLRVAAVMSNDHKLLKSFSDSDPYTFMADDYNKHGHDLSRDEAKTAILSSIYAFDVDSPASLFYPKLNKWMIKCRKKLSSDGYISSILNRKFIVDNFRTEKSAINASIQGSVAHAMQHSINRVWKIYPDNILADNHDSLVMTCSDDKNKISSMINDVANIMTTPFNGILKNNPVFPIVVSVGKEYKKWKKFKRYG